MCTARKPLLVLAVLFAEACADATTVSEEPDSFELSDVGPSLSVVPYLPPVCGDATTTPLILDDAMQIGSVEVTQGPDNLYVVYRTDPDRPMLATSLFVGSSASDIPTSWRGRPRLLLFPYKSGHRGVHEVVWEIPRSELSGPDVVVAAFALVLNGLEGAWGEGEEISPGKHWSMYFTHSMTSCAAETVYPTSDATVSAPAPAAGGGASIYFPAGAVQGPVDITIDPSSVQELLEHTSSPASAAFFTTASAAEGMGAAGPDVFTAETLIDDLPTVYGTVPIEGTVWDFGPDGQTFDTPVLVTLRYEDAWIPEGVDESDLQIFVINGIYDKRPSTVDPIRNTVTADISHFSYGYIGFPTSPEADLSIVSATESADPILVGESVTYQATLSNIGPYLYPDVGVAYQAFGDVVAGALAPGCVEVATPIYADVQINCSIGTLGSVGQFVAPPATFVPQGIGNGTVTVWMDPLSNNSTDPVLGNNRLIEDFTVDAGGPSQLTFGETFLDQAPSSDTVWYTFEGRPGEFARVQVWIQEAAGNYSVQLVIRDPSGDEIYPDGAVGGRATDNSSAYHVFAMADFPVHNTWSVGLKPYGTGPYRIGLGTGAGRLDETYGTEGTGVAYGPNSNAADPFLDWEWVGDVITVVGEEELVRFDANGEMDASFGSGGVVDLQTALGAGRWGQALGVQPDGKVVVAARQTASPYEWVVARFDAGGTLDPTFGTGGLTEVAMGVDIDSKPLGVDFQQNGPDLDIVVGGDAGAPPNRVGIVRFNPDGTLDTGFGVGGKVLEARAMTPTKMAMQSDGSILIHGWDDLLRYTPDGVLDTSFGTNGILDYAIVGNAFGIDVLPDDRLLVTGSDVGTTFLMRLTSNGARDGTFAGGGYQTYDFGFSNQRFQAATPDGAGGLIAVGYQRVAGGDYEWLVSGLSFDGVLDPDFGIGGYLTEIRTDNARAVGIDSAGHIVVGGQAQNSARGIELTRHIRN